MHLFKFRPIQQNELVLKPGLVVIMLQMGKTGPVDLGNKANHLAHKNIDLGISHPYAFELRPLQGMILTC